jgi:hypothetical protein
MKKILGAVIGNCIHIAGICHFLDMAESCGYETKFLGARIPLIKVIDEIKSYNPDITALSYRLTPEVAGTLFEELMSLLKTENIANTQFIFGGTPSVGKVARKFSLFKKIFTGIELPEEIIGFLKGDDNNNIKKEYGNNIFERINYLYPYPVIRHHFGRPTVKDTVSGIKKISKAKILDVISIGPDQNAQEFFFHPEFMSKEKDGAGGVPLRSENDLKQLYEASRYGNYPLMRCYAGTNDLIKWAEMSINTINNAWAAIPLCWYSTLDGRSRRDFPEVIQDNQSVIKWYADRNLTVEINESHQWSLRESHDALAVAMAYISAYNAKKLGVKNYISQYMFNTPPGLSLPKDLAKMKAKNELIQSLEDENFKFFREVRTGLNSLSPNQNFAKGQLSASIQLMLYMKPHILHVVGFSEGDHMITADELIESCEIAHGVIHRSLNQLPEIGDMQLQIYKSFLINEAKIIIEAIKKIGSGSADALCDPDVITKAIRIGILDTPHFKGNIIGKGNIRTKIIDGGCYPVSKSNGKILSEKQRIDEILKDNKLK